MSRLDGSVDSANSTVIPLGVLEEFVGEFTNVSSYGSISVSCQSDVGSTFSGLKLEWSTNGFTADLASQDFTFDPVVISQDGFTVHATVRASYVRVRYQNSVDAQSFFVLETRARRGSISGTIRSMDPKNTFITNLDAQTVQAVTSGVGRFNPEQLQIAVMDDVNTAEFPGAQGPYLFVSPRPWHATNTVRRVSPASLVASRLTNFENDRRTLLSITNRVARGNLYLQLTTAAGLSASSYDLEVPPGHTWASPGFAGNVFGVWDEVYVEDSGLVGSAVSVENFYG